MTECRWGDFWNPQGVVCSSGGPLPLAPRATARARRLCAQAARTIGELEAASQNLVHADLTITNGVYGVLTDDYVQHTIASLGRLSVPEAGGDQNSLVAMLETLLSQPKRGTRSEL